MKCFYLRDPVILIRAYKTYVRPLSKYVSPAWSPYDIGDIQSFTSKVFHVCHKPYMTCVERLKYLRLNSLDLQRLHTDLTKMFKIVKYFSSPSLKNAL